MGPPYAPPSLPTGSSVSLRSLLLSRVTPIQVPSGSEGALGVNPDTGARRGGECGSIPELP